MDCRNAGVFGCREEWEAWRHHCVWLPVISRSSIVGLAGLLLGAAAAACSGADAGEADDATGADAAEVVEARIKVAKTARLPIAEVSGLGRRLVAGKASYLAVSDATTTLVTFDVDSNGKASRITPHDLSAVFGRGRPQWEAVAGDAKGSVFLLAEATDKISVLDSKLERVVHTIQLSIPRDHALSREWRDDANSHGEGMMLLANGHILVIKEKNPVALIEFGVEGEAAEGYRAELALGDGTFKLPRGASSTMTPLHHWVLKAADMRTVSDVSELAVEADGRLLILSDQGRAVVRVERGLRPDEDKLDLKTLYKLPSEVDKPEGLVMAGAIPMVAIDGPEAGETLFALDPLP
jgi:uncharacterized protein YjiK